MQGSVGAAFAVAGALGHHGHPQLAAAIHGAASAAFFHGFHTAVNVSAAVAVALMARALLPSHRSDASMRNDTATRHPMPLSARGPAA